MTSAAINSTEQGTDLLRARIEILLQEKTAIAGRARQLIHSSGGDAHAELLTAIRETQRPCKLVFRNERQEELAFEIASARVLQICASKSQSAIVLACGSPVEVGAIPDPSQLGQLIYAFCSNTNVLSVETMPAAQDTAAIELGSRHRQNIC